MRRDHTRKTVLSIALALIGAFAGSPFVQAIAGLSEEEAAILKVCEHFQGIDESTIRVMLEIVTLVGKGKPESAGNLFLENLQKGLEPDPEFEQKIRRDFAKISGRLGFVQTIEYIGHAFLSKGKCVTVFAVNTDYVSNYVTITKVLQDGKWRMHGYAWKHDWEEMLHLWSGISRQPIVMREFVKESQGRLAEDPCN
jgi:hypothetical protein